MGKVVQSNLRPIIQLNSKEIFPLARCSPADKCLVMAPSCRLWQTLPGVPPPNRNKYQTIIARKLENYHVIPSARAIVTAAAHLSTTQYFIFFSQCFHCAIEESIADKVGYKIQYATFIRAQWQFLMSFWLRECDIHTATQSHNENLNRNSIDIILFLYIIGFLTKYAVFCLFCPDV